MPDPLWINASAGAPSYDATELRQAMALALAHGAGQNLGARSGVRPGGTQLETSIARATITVQEGVACLYEPTPSTARAPYWVALPADETHTLTAADAVNPRKDIIVLRVYDHDQDASGLRLARSEYLVGTATPSPTEPTVPAGAFRLATIDVPASGGGSPVVTINHPFIVAAGGILPVRNSTEEAALSLYDGLVIYRIDTDVFRARVNGAWREVPMYATDGDLSVPGDLSVAGIGQNLFVRKTATESVTSSVTMQDDDHLFAAVAANSTYLVDMLIRYDGASGSSVGELKMQFTMPAGASFTGHLDGFQFAATGNEGDLMQAVLDGEVMNTGTRGNGVFLTAHVLGNLVVAGTAGTLRLQWAQFASNATATRVILGSHLALRRVA